MELGGPEKIRLDKFVGRYLTVAGGSHEIEIDPTATYFGASIDDASLVPQGDAILGSIRYQKWLDTLRF